MSTYVKISTINVSTATNEISFTSIPNIYTDLKLEMSIRTDRADNGDNIGLVFNSTASGYSDKHLYGYGTGVGSDSGSSSFLRVGRVDAANNTSNTFSNGSIYIPNYAGSTYKSVSIDTVYENNASGNAYCEMYAGLWSNTAAITSIKLYVVDASFLQFVQYSSFTLYGIKKD